MIENKDIRDVLSLAFFGTFFVAWLTKQFSPDDRSLIWLTICAVVALILALLALFGLINRRT